MTIESPANPRIRAAASLRDRRDRERTGLTLVDGGREARRAIEAGVAVETAFVYEDRLASPDGHAAVEALRERGLDDAIVTVGERAFEKLAYGDRADGLILVVRPPSPTLASLSVGPEPLVVVTEDVEKPGNLGAILRTADGAGVDALIAADPRTDLFNPGAIRASLGTIFSRPVVSATTVETLDWLTARAIRPIAARVDAPTTWDAVDLRGPVAIVVGSEAGGLSPAWDDPRVTPVRIPMRGAADSLNVSVAAAILLYEAVRQRS